MARVKIPNTPKIIKRMKTTSFTVHSFFIVMSLVMFLVISLIIFLSYQKTAFMSVDEGDFLEVSNQGQAPQSGLSPA